MASTFPELALPSDLQSLLAGLRWRIRLYIWAEGIALDEGFRALHAGRSPSRFRRAGPLPEADRAHAGAAVLHHPVLLGTDADLDQVVVALAKLRAHAERLGEGQASSPTGSTRRGTV